MQLPTLFKYCKTFRFRSFLIHVGQVGSVLYNCVLSVYYVSVIKFSMSDSAFKAKIELFSHFLINAYAICGACFLLSREYFNPAKNFCWISAVPSECINDHDQECIRGDDKAYKYRWWFFNYALSGTFIIIPFNMILIACHVWNQKKKSERWLWSEKGGHRKGFLSRTFKNCQSSLITCKKGCQVMKKDINGTSCHHDPTNHSDGVKANQELLSLDFSISPKGRDSIISNDTSLPKKARRESRLSFHIHGVDDDDIEEQSKAPRPQCPKVSRSGTEKDPFAFNLQTVRNSIKKEGGSITSDTSNYTKLEGMLTSQARRLSLRSSRSSTLRGAFKDSEVIMQALFYIFAYLLCWVLPFVGRWDTIFNLLSSRFSVFYLFDILLILVILVHNFSGSMKVVTENLHFLLYCWHELSILSRDSLIF